MSDENWWKVSTNYNIMFGCLERMVICTYVLSSMRKCLFCLLSSHKYDNIRKLINAAL